MTGPESADGNRVSGSGQAGPSAPAISLPKGGGAIRGIGEKFAANPVTGTGSMSIPIATSPGRSGFGPQLSLSYDSGAGNGPFGLGWSLSLPAITRKTDKGLPRYRDAEESDVFILSGAEDLVPVLIQNGKQWEQHSEDRTISAVKYRIYRYRPRIEGLFARIERWVRVRDGDTHWRSISKDNITTLYGKREVENQPVHSRIADPADDSKVFSWLICETYDDKGNVMLYGYVPEDSRNVDVSQANERNRARSANRYLKRIQYGNVASLLAGGQSVSPLGPNLSQMKWLFEVVFDYDEGHYQFLSASSADPQFVQPKFIPTKAWSARKDAFSAYRAGFEVRTYRLCRRVLMFHHFDTELGTPNYLVRSTAFTYREEPIGSFITSVTQSGYVRKKKQDGTFHYLKKSLPPVDFEYTEAKISSKIRDVAPESLENLPIGLDGNAYQWVDLDGEGLSGILTEQADAWFYKRNLSPINVVGTNGSKHTEARFAPVELVGTKPAVSLRSGAQFLDLAGDGQLDVVTLRTPTPGFYERTSDEQWDSYTPFDSLPVLDWGDPNLKFVDLTGDGHADVLITEDEVLRWHPSLAEEGFGPQEFTRQSRDEETGPKLVFADGTQSIYLADMSGDGLTDLARIRNGEVCYWPNLGYGRFGAKVTMDNAPCFDFPDQFDQKRIRLADIDGSGTTDLIYLGRDRVAIHRNQSGNGFGNAEYLTAFPPVDDLAAVQALDLLGNGTACLVWSSPLPGDARRPMRYIDLMGGQKPHLLVKTVNNLGAETVMSYAPSTKFYLADKFAGKPWITKLPFPVHVVERVDTHDRISGNRFVARYAYHHGYFDGEEREFRGFGMVEQRDTEEIAALNASGTLPNASNLDVASHVPPVLTKTWFHTGAFLRRDRISNFFAGLVDRTDSGEYYREPAWRSNDVEAKKHLLDDTVLPAGLLAEEEREACRALKGAMLRQEVYALDGTAKADDPYTVTEQNFTIDVVQPRAGNRHGVFFTHAREAISYHYERNPTDPRITHALTLDVDDYGNVLRSIAVGYPRANIPERLPEQNETHLTLTLDRFANRDAQSDWRRIGVPVETRTYEVVKPPTASLRFSWKELRGLIEAIVPLAQVEPSAAMTVPYENWDWRDQWDARTEPGGLVAGQAANTRLRLLEHIRTRYRKNNLTALSPLGSVESLALPGESYKLALTPGLIASVFKRKRVGQPDEALLPNPPDSLLEGKGADQGGYVEIDGKWWIPSGRSFYSRDPADTALVELAEARAHFFFPRRVEDPFANNAFVDYDVYDLLAVGTEDALLNKVSSANDYRVLQPNLVTDPNRNRTAASFDALGMLVATAMMGKPPPALVEGDSLAGFNPDLNEAVILNHLADPRVNPQAVIQRATTRLVYDLFAFYRTKDQPDPQPAVVCTMARETHDSDPVLAGGLKIQHSFSYSDGFGREIQKKIQAEPGRAPTRDANGKIVIGADGQPVLTLNGVSPRWVCSGWTVFNNKGKPVRQYEPFFTDTHRFEFDVRIGVSPVLFYDPVERLVATLHPNHSWGKVVFDPWQQATYDANDTVLNADDTTDPKSDADVKGYFSRLPDADYLPTWYEQRIQLPASDSERVAADKTAIHRQTPAIAYLDTLGRIFLTIAANRFERNGAVIAESYPTRVDLDIEGNQRVVRDAIVQNGDQLGRIVMRYDYDMLGNRIHQASMEAGERWMLNDVEAKPIRAWDSRGFMRRMTYDELRRPIALLVSGNGINNLVSEKTVYGEDQQYGPPNPEQTNHRTRVYKVQDGAGIVTSVDYDFKGNLRQSQRKLAREYKTTLDWSSAVPLEADTYTNVTTYDALNRPVTVTTPDNSVHRPVFNEANLLDKVDVNLRGAKDAAGAPIFTPFVTNIDYDAKGQRELIAYQNGVQTAYTYDPLTFRLTGLRTTRPVTPNTVASQLFSNPGVVQDLRYTYDPAGSITRIADTALKTVFFNQTQVDPISDYTYDAIYRLIEATGREHIGQTARDFNPQNRRDYDFVGLGDFIVHPNDFQGMRRYTERYEYDAVGNFQFMRHIANGGSWTREYQYQEDSLTEPATQAQPAKKSNRLTNSVLGNPLNHTESYTYSDAQGRDVHGCIAAIDSMKMVWGFKDQLQQVGLGGGSKAYYVYDSSGQRVRKVIENQNATPNEERLYLGGFEVYRKFGVNALTRETLHIMDDKQRIALVETQMPPTLNAPVVRYQLDNHLGSASLELDQASGLITYEEHHPYGTTSFQAGSSAAEVSLKRYRYNGKERDEETGFSYYGARYYLSWLGRWATCDPRTGEVPSNAYRALLCNPVNFTDPNGMEDSWWQTTKQGIRSAQRWVHEKSAKAGEFVQDLGEKVIERGNIKSAFVKDIIRDKAVFAGAVVATGLEVGAGVAMAGPNLLMLPDALSHVGEELGHGASDIVEGVRTSDSNRAWSGVARSSGAIATVAGAVALVGGGIQGGRAWVSSRQSGTPPVATETPPAATETPPAAPSAPVNPAPAAPGPSTPTISPRQALHQIGPRQKGLPAHDPTRSILTADPAELIPKLGTGQQVGKTPVGKPGSQEAIEHSKPTGYVLPNPKTINPAEGTIYAEPTTRVKAHYAKDEVHFVPAPGRK